MQVIRCAASCALVFLRTAPPSALAWRKGGHRVVGTVATSLLTPDARSQVADLLGPNAALPALPTLPANRRGHGTDHTQMVATVPEDSLKPAA